MLLVHTGSPNVDMLWICNLQCSALTTDHWPMLGGRPYWQSTGHQSPSSKELVSRLWSYRIKLSRVGFAPTLTGLRILHTVRYQGNMRQKSHYRACKSSSRPAEQQSHSHGSLFGTVKVGRAAGKLWQLGTSSVSSRPQMFLSPPFLSSSFPCLCSRSPSLPLSPVWRKKRKKKKKTGNAAFQLWNGCFRQLLPSHSSAYPRCSQSCVKMSELSKWY